MTNFKYVGGVYMMEGLHRMATDAGAQVTHAHTKSLTDEVG